jgi:hypothetical protein
LNAGAAATAQTRDRTRVVAGLSFTEFALAQEANQFD